MGILDILANFMYRLFTTILLSGVLIVAFILLFGMAKTPETKPELVLENPEGQGKGKKSEDETNKQKSAGQEKEETEEVMPEKELEEQEKAVTEYQRPMKYTIRSAASSWNFLYCNPDNTNEVWLEKNAQREKNPQGFEWNIEKVGEYFSIRSLSSGKYSDGADVKTNRPVLVTLDSGTNPKCILWCIEFIDGNNAFKCVSSSLFLDGRQRRDTGNQMMLRTRIPKTKDRFLQWIIQPVQPPLLGDSRN